MIHELNAYDPAGRRSSGRFGRAVAELSAQADLDLYRAEAVAAIQLARVDAVGVVAQRALLGVAFVSQVEQQLGQAVPIAVSRLQAIGDLAALSMGQVVADTATQMGRRSCSR